MKIAVIGLGNMGQPIARNVLQAGYELTVYNRTKQKTEELASEGAQAVDTPRQAAESADIVITMLSDDDSVSAVTFGEDGLIAGLAENGIHISMSTISVEFSEKLAAAHAKKGQSFLAAPVLGRPDAAAKAALRIISAGPVKRSKLPSLCLTP